MLRFETLGSTVVCAVLAFGCGQGDGPTETKKEGSEVAADPANEGTSKNADDGHEDTVGSPATPLVIVELVTGSLAYDFGVAKATIDGNVTFEAADAGKIGIEDVYYGTNLVVGNVDKKTNVKVEGWAISSTTADKSWMDTTCGENKPNADGSVNEICHVEGPLVDAQKQIQELGDGASEAEILKILEDKFTAHDFKVVAKGSKTYETEGNDTTKVELKP